MDKTKKRQLWGLIALVAVMLLLDQALKVYVKLNFFLGEVRPILGDWFSLCFVENNGMAFGIQWFDKIFLTLFRIVAVGALIYYVGTLLKRGCRTSYLMTIGLVIAGAMGNIIDCMFYGLIFTDSYGQIAQLVPWGQGYESFMYGRVVDMFSFSFFPPVFNIADSCITVAVFLIIIFFRKDLNDSLEKQPIEQEQSDDAKKI